MISFTTTLPLKNPGQGNNDKNINVEKGQILMTKGLIYGQQYYDVNIWCFRQ